jgi:hypothetical protein
VNPDGKPQDGMLQELQAFSGCHGKSRDCHRHQRSLLWHNVGFLAGYPVTRADDYQQWTKDFLSGA